MDSLNNKQFWEEFFEEFVKECKELYNKKGFNYEIPKEEQVRCFLYYFLKKKNYLVESESNLFKEETKKSVGLYDLRVIMDDYDILIELKRTTALDTWYNDFTNYLESWKKDIEKLEMIDNKGIYNRWNIKNKLRKCFLLCVFTNDNSKEHLDKLDKKIDEFKDIIGKKWSIIPETDLSFIGNYRYSFSKEDTRNAKVKFIIWMENENINKI